MFIIGCDLHTRFQRIATLDTQTGELVERRLEHDNGEARAFYAALPGAARVGMEATGYSRWFETMLAELGHELWVGDAAEIRASVVRKQKTDSRDAYHLLDLLLKDKFPRVWIASPSERDVRQLLRHRQKLVCWRISVRNQLHALAMGEVICRKEKLWTAAGRKELESYLGLNPRESSSGGKQRLGSISKQGNCMLRFLLAEAAQTASRLDAELRRDYLRLKASSAEFVG